MKFPKHIILDVSLPPLFSTNKITLKHYDSLYKFTPSNLTQPFNISPKNSSYPSPLTPLLSLCGLRLNFSKLCLKQPYPQNTSHINTSFTKPLLEVNERIELKLKKNVGNLGENSTKTLFSIFFLRKEEIYTKLKYSRCPQYDMVSGGLAALFAAFLGFLICEKFGLELLDSGDFYIAFMYGVFATFSLRPLVRSMTKGVLAYNVVSPKHLFNYLFVLFNLIIRC